MNLSRRTILAGAAALATLPARAATPLRGGRFIYARSADSLQLDPVFTDSNTDIWVMNSIYDTLLLPGPEGKGFVPGLATSWTMAADGASLLLTLREGVRFSDGAPLEAEDVKWSLDRARDPQNGPWTDLVSAIGAVEVAGPASIVLKLKHPDPTLLAALATFNTAILPRRPFEATPGANMLEKTKAFAEHPIGTGPFVLKDWQRGQRMLLARNPLHWRRDAAGEALPYVDELEFQIIPDDATRILKLKAGEVHGTEFVPFTRVAELKADPAIRMELWPSTATTFLSFNIRPALNDGAANPLSNLKFRLALNYAVDKDAVIAITTRGLGKPMHSFMPASLPLFLDQGPLYPYDPAKAKAVLAESGIPSGVELACMAVSGNQVQLSNLTAVQQMWGKMGVKLKIDQQDSASLIRRYRANDFQMRAAGWTSDIADPGQVTMRFAYSPNIQALRSGWESPRLNELYVAAMQEMDVAKRRAQFKEIQEIFTQAATIVPLYETPYTVAFRTNAHGFVQLPLGNNLFEGVWVDRA